MVFFRAADLRSAFAVLAGMVGVNGVVLSEAAARLPGMADLIARFGLTVGPVQSFGLTLSLQIALLLAFVWVLPNTQEWMHRYRTALAWRPRESWLEQRLPFIAWRPGIAVGFAVGALGFFTLALALSAAPSEFLYFQF